MAWPDGYEVEKPSGVRCLEKRPGKLAKPLRSKIHKARIPKPTAVSKRHDINICWPIDLPPVAVSA